MQNTAVTDAEEGLVDNLPEEYAWLDGGQSYVACAFYTPNYLPQILSLKASLEKVGINHYFKRYERGPTWEQTTRLKPVFVQHALQKFSNKSVLYLDADAVVRRPLVFFDTVETDMAILFHHVKASGHNYLRISAGTVFIRNTEGGQKFARLWKEAEQYCGRLTLDEDMIYMAFSDMAGVSITVLPPSYVKIFDKPGEEPVIEHFQASRSQFKWRRLIRKMRRLGVIGGGTAAILLIWWLTQHLRWVP